MERTFETLRVTRQNALDAIEGLSKAQLFVIPNPHRNNIIWNLGHMVSAQQGLVYRLSGVEPRVSADFIKVFGKGSVPTSEFDGDMLKQVEDNFITSFDQMVEDYNEGVFKTYKPYSTSYGVALNSVEDAIRFLPVHEALHLGVIMSLKKLV